MNPHGKYGIGAQVAIIMDNEGGYTDHAADRGGPTNAGTRRVMFHDYQPSFPGVIEACDKIKEAVGGDWYYAKKFAAWDGTK